VEDNTSTTRIGRLSILAIAVIILLFVAYVGRAEVQVRGQLHTATQQRTSLLRTQQELTHTVGELADSVTDLRIAAVERNKLVSRQQVALAQLLTIINRQNEELRKAGLPTVPVPDLLKLGASSSSTSPGGGGGASAGTANTSSGGGGSADGSRAPPSPRRTPADDGGGSSPKPTPKPTPKPRPTNSPGNLPLPHLPSLPPIPTCLICR
jgi:uncharacterized membrane protein YgcG